MERDQLEHVIKAAVDIVDDEVIVVRSQAVLGQFPDAPDSLLQSSEVDLYPRTQPDRADEIDGAIGEGSPFHESYHYYAHGVGPETSILPAGWEDRLVKLDLPAHKAGERAVGWCISASDVVLSKLAAGRPQDFEFAKNAIGAGLGDATQLELGVDLMPASHSARVRTNLAIVLARTS
ncbi:MAG: DUF6036 family nucleotidyltransferase [Gaiella sp.]